MVKKSSLMVRSSRQMVVLVVRVADADKHLEVYKRQGQKMSMGQVPKRSTVGGVSG